MKLPPLVKRAPRPVLSYMSMTRSRTLIRLRSDRIPSNNCIPLVVALGLGLLASAVTAGSLGGITRMVSHLAAVISLTNLAVGPFIAKVIEDREDRAVATDQEGV